MNMRCVTLLSICLLSIVSLSLSAKIYGQSTLDLDALIRHYTEDAGEALNPDYLEDLQDKWQNYYQHPLNINNVGREELESLELLEEGEIDAILSYRDTMDRFLSVHELNAVKGLSEKKAALIAPFFKVKVPLYTASFSEKSRMYKFLPPKYSIGWSGKIQTSVYEDQKKNNAIQGAIFPQAFKLQYRDGTRISMGISADQQLGEPMVAYRNIRLPDQISFHYFIQRKKGGIRRIAIGDYSVRMGEGLILYQGFRPGKSSLVNKVHYGLSRQLYPYRSKGSFAYCRGGAVELSLKKRWSGLFFLSSRNLDASFEWVQDSTTLRLKSINRSGLHNTEGTISRRQNLNVKLIGGTISYRKNLNHYRMNVVFQSMKPRDKSLVLKPMAKGYAGLSFRHYLGGVLLFGESVLTNDSSYANISGLLYPVHKTLGLSAVYRSYSPGYTALWANPLRASTYAGNEKGLYLGMEWTPDKHWGASFYTDFWSFPAGILNFPFKVEGHDALLKFSYNRHKQYLLYLMLRYKQKKELELPQEAAKFKLPVQLHKVNIRVHGEYIISKALVLRSRYERIVFRKKGAYSSGYMLYEDLLYKARKHPVVLKFRYAIFNADAYELRIFAYENALSGSYSIPFYYGRGSRVYAYMRYRLRHLALEFKASYTKGKAGIDVRNPDWNVEWRMRLMF